MGAITNTDVIIYGGSKGIGLNIAKDLAERGYGVTNVSRSLPLQHEAVFKTQLFDVTHPEFSERNTAIIQGSPKAKIFVFNIGGSFGRHNVIPTVCQIKYLMKANLYYIVDTIECLRNFGRMKNNLFVFLLTNEHTKINGNIAYYMSKVALDLYADKLAKTEEASANHVIKFFPPLILYDERHLPSLYKNLKTDEERKAFIEEVLGGHVPVDPNTFAKQIVDKIVHIRKTEC